MCVMSLLSGVAKGVFEGPPVACNSRPLYEGSAVSRGVTLCLYCDVISEKRSPIVKLRLCSLFRY